MAKKEDNLMTPQELNARLTPEQRKENASKAGKASAEARKERKLIRERILERMNAQDWDEYINGIIDRAKESKADAEFLRDTIGEKPIEKLAVTNIDQSIEELHGYFERADNTPAEE